MHYKICTKAKNSNGMAKEVSRQKRSKYCGVKESTTGMRITKSVRKLRILTEWRKKSQSKKTFQILRSKGKHKYIFFLNLKRQ